MKGGENVGNRTVKNYSISTELYLALKKYSDESKIPMSRLIDMGIELILRERGQYE